MTICDKIQTIGNSLEENLNERGVQCTFGKKSGESTILDMVEMVNDTNFKGSSDVNLKISANRPYLLTGETTDVVVKLEDGLCEPLKNKNVTIGQSIFIDNGTSASHNDSWNVSNGTMTRMDSYTRLVESAQTLMCQMNSGYITPTSTVEFDFKAVDGVKNWGLVYIRNSAGGTSLADLSLNNVGGEIGEWIHLKIVFNNTSTITIYSNKLENPITKTLSSTSTNYRLVLYCGGVNTELHFKNVTVYETINGVTDEKGEFALYNVSVTDDTTFTATYGTETATCLVEYCTYVNYLVDNEHDANSYYSTGTVTYDKVGATLDATTFSSSNYQLNFRPLNDVITVPYEVKFEILDNDTGNFRTYFYNTNFSGSAIASGTIYRQYQQPTPIRFVVTSSGITRYVGNTSTELTVSPSIASKVGARFGYWQPTTGKIKIRNFRIKPL